MNDRLTLALPSKGAIAEPTYTFLKDCGLKVSKPNPRQYVGSLSTMPHVDVLFQRVKDVAYKIADGTAHVGITGMDVVKEYPSDQLIVIHDQLQYGHCKLVVAVPEAWVDVHNMTDLADIAIDFREQKQRNLRIATTYTHLARQFLHHWGIHHFTLVKAEGAIEAAPTIGYADVVIDLTQTGTTLRENHLKTLPDGVIIESQACLIANRDAIRNHPQRLGILQTLLEYIDATLQGTRHYQVTLNIQGDSAESVATLVADNPLTRGLLGPTIAPVYQFNGDGNGSWHTVTITISHKNLLKAVDYLRSIGGTHVIVVPVRYVFMETSPTFDKLMDLLK